MQLWQDSQLSLVLFWRITKKLKYFSLPERFFISDNVSVWTFFKSLYFCFDITFGKLEFDRSVLSKKRLFSQKRSCIYGLGSSRSGHAAYSVVEVGDQNIIPLIIDLEAMQIQHSSWSLRKFPSLHCTNHWIYCISLVIGATPAI